MIYLIGASGHAKVVIEIIEQQGFFIGGLQDANPAIKSLFDYHVFEELPAFFDPNNDEVFISIGNNAIRKQIASLLDYKYVTAIHLHAIISKRITIGEGTAIMAGVTINSDVQIGKHVIVNTNASIDHDCILGDFVHVSPNSALAGNVIVGEGTHIGIGASIIQGVKIGSWCTIGAGAVIIRDVPDGATVVGNPGRIIKIKEIR